jgi:hypothetical protein
MGVKRNVYWILMGKPEGKSPLGRPKHEWADNIKMELREIGCGGMDWTDLLQDSGQCKALVRTVMNLRVPYHAEKSLSSYTTGGFSRRAQLPGDGLLANIRP